MSGCRTPRSSHRRPDNPGTFRAPPSLNVGDHPGHAGRHQLIKPFTPKHNGKVERYQRILTEEVLYARPFTSEAQRAQAIQMWNVHYNYHRPHGGLDGQTPYERLKQRTQDPAVTAPRQLHNPAATPVVSRLSADHFS